MECAICVQSIGDEESTALQCGHAFHSHCISKWFSVTPSCPYCRAKDCTYFESIAHSLKFDLSSESFLEFARITLRRLNTHVVQNNTVHIGDAQFVINYAAGVYEHKLVELAADELYTQQEKLESFAYDKVPRLSLIIIGLQVQVGNVLNYAS